MKVPTLVLNFIMISYYLVPGVITLFLLICNKLHNCFVENLLSPGLELDMGLSDDVVSVHSLLNFP